MVAICDNKDTCIGLRLAGIEGSVVHSGQEFSQALDKAMNDRQVAIVVIAKRYASQAETARINKAMPLILEI